MARSGLFSFSEAKRTVVRLIVRAFGTHGAGRFLMLKVYASLKSAGRVLLLIGFLASSALPNPAEECGANLTEQDKSSIQATIEKYRASWLRGDREAVLDTFTDDGVVLPAQGAAALVGRSAIRNYWWPEGVTPPKITKLDITYENIGGDCRIAYVYGRDEVGWTVQNRDMAESHASSGTYLNVMKKLPDGSWRISHHMWDIDPSKRR